MEKKAFINRDYQPREITMSDSARFKSLLQGLNPEYVKVIDKACADISKAIDKSNLKKNP